MILDLEWYAPRLLKIKTKTSGDRPLYFRKIQKRFIQHLKDDFPDGIIRSLSLKPRQAGWSTTIASYNFHRVVTSRSFSCLVMADKFARTSAVYGIYKKYHESLPPAFRPMVQNENNDEIYYNNPDVTQRDINPGLDSRITNETAQDPNAGKSASRQAAHLSEYAFYPYAMEVDQSVQNSIPLARGTAIFKESTANGMGGDGEAFYEQWMAAERGEYLYKPFFVPWYEVDDYVAMPERGFLPTKEELDILSRCPDVTHANLMWRRIKIRETMTAPDSGLSPEELFKQDFPLYPEEAFLSSGRPVFDPLKVKNWIDKIRRNPPKKANVVMKKTYLTMYQNNVTVFRVPEVGEKYSIGADVSEGLSVGDNSHAKVLDSEFREVAFIHGKIDPDHYGRLLVELAKIYNNAIITPEVNNMGHTTLTAIKDEGYLRVYSRSVHDELEDEKFTKKLGWRTTAQNHNLMLNRFVSAYRDDSVLIRDIDTHRELMKVVRGDGGSVDLNGKDRTVATCLALIGFDQIFEAATVTDPQKKKRILFETADHSRSLIK